MFEFSSFQFFGVLEFFFFWSFNLYRLFFMSVTTFGCNKISTHKFKKKIFQGKFYSLRAHADYLTVLKYLATWRTAKLGIFIHSLSRNLPWCSQSINSHSWLHFFILPPPKKIFCITPWDITLKFSGLSNLAKTWQIFFKVWYGHVQTSKILHHFWMSFNKRNLLLIDPIIVYSQKISNWDL